MVVIRMARGGAKNRPFYNIVVADSRMPRPTDAVKKLIKRGKAEAAGQQPAAAPK